MDLMQFLNTPRSSAHLMCNGRPYFASRMPETLGLQSVDWKIIKRAHALNPYYTTRVFQPELRDKLLAKGWTENSDSSFSKTTAGWKRELKKYLLGDDKTLALKIKGATYCFNKRSTPERRYLRIKPMTTAGDWKIIEVAHFLNRYPSTLILSPNCWLASKLDAQGWRHGPDNFYYHKEK